jgi:hypothetical protein
LISFPSGWPQARTTINPVETKNLMSREAV